MENRDLLTNRIKYAFKGRMYAWELCFQGNLTSLQALELMLPNFLRSKKDATVNLCGQPFISPAGLGYFSGLMWQISEKDQYRLGLIKGGIIIDGGASAGIFTCLVAYLNPNAKIYAFEPSPVNLPLLRKNVSYYPNVEVMPYALGAVEKMGEFAIGSYEVTDNMFGKRTREIQNDLVNIEIITIDSLNIPLSFLKMDIEGSEMSALAGAIETIKKYKPTIVMSAYHHPEDKVELPKYLNSITPYDCELRHDCEEDLVCVPK